MRTETQEAPFEPQAFYFASGSIEFHFQNAGKKALLAGGQTSPHSYPARREPHRDSKRVGRMEKVSYPAAP
jgi:hypothetical protein